MLPAWAASYVVTLAKAIRQTDQYILWELPLAAGHIYTHAALMAAGAKTIPSSRSFNSDMDQIRKGIEEYGNSQSQSQDQSQ